MCPTEKSCERRQRRSLITAVDPFGRTFDCCHDTPIRAGPDSGPACDTNSFPGGVDSVKQGSAVASAFRQKYSSVWIWQDNCPGPLVAITALIPRLCASGRGNFLTCLNCFSLVSSNGKKWVKWSCQGLLFVQWLRFGLRLPFGCRFEFRDLLNDWFSATEFLTMHSFCLTCQSVVVHHTAMLPDSLYWKKNKNKPTLLSSR